MVSQCTIPVIDRNRARFGMESGTSPGDRYSNVFILKGYTPFAAAFNTWTDTEKRTPAPVATESPDFSIIPLVGHRLQPNYFRRGGRRQKGKPGREEKLRRS